MPNAPAPITQVERAIASALGAARERVLVEDLASRIDALVEEQVSDMARALDDMMAQMRLLAAKTKALEAELAIAKDTATAAVSENARLRAYLAACGKTWSMEVAHSLIATALNTDKVLPSCFEPKGGR